jgi:hypothetical protein
VNRNVFCRPSGPEIFITSDPGAACFALAPGYLLAAPPALHAFAPGSEENRGEPRRGDRQFATLHSVGPSGLDWI